MLLFILYVYKWDIITLVLKTALLEGADFLQLREEGCAGVHAINTCLNGVT